MTLNQVFEMEKQANIALTKFKRDLVSTIAVMAMEGVQPMDGLNGVIVDFGTIIQTGGKLSPETYLPLEQAKAVERALSSCSTITSTILKIDELVDRKKVYIGNSGITLNHKTVAVLRDSIADLDAEVA